MLRERNAWFVPKRGEVYWADPITDGSCVQSKLRPWVVVSNDLANRSSPNVTMVPCTSKKKDMYLPTHVTAFLNGKENTILCEQVSTFGKSTMGRYVGRVGSRTMEEIDRALRVHLDLEEKEDED